MARATKRQVQTALRAIRKHYGFGPDDYHGPRLVEEYHGWYHTYRNAIVWEDGPYEWSVAVSCGCATCKHECGDPIPMPKGTYSEAIDSYAIGLYTI